MDYFIIILKIIILEYLIIIAHELIHVITALLMKLKPTYIYIIPFVIHFDNSKFNIKFKPLKEDPVTSRTHFKAVTISSKLNYTILLKKLRFYNYVGPLFDFIIFIILLPFGLVNIQYSYLALLALIHLTISSINFFNSDGKFAIGSKEDTRCAFDLVRSFTICGNGVVPEVSKRILTDIHMEISENIEIEEFDVNDLWNFLNNISFFTNSLLSYLNGDIFKIHNKSFEFFNRLIIDFDKIKLYDYRQEEKTSIAILYYLIYKKISDNTFDIVNFNIPSLKFFTPYYKELYNLFFNNSNNLKFLNNNSNLPSYASYCHGYNKLLKNLLTYYVK